MGQKEAVVKRRRGNCHSIPLAGLLLLLAPAVGVGSARCQVRVSADQELAARFSRLLIGDPDSLSCLLDPGESAISSRLGIEYDGVRNKFLIGFDFDEDTRQLLLRGVLRCQTTTEELADGFMLVKMDVQDHGPVRRFYFNQQRQLVSPVYYYARSWTKRESPHFTFWISDPTLFHPDAIARLESFLRQMAGLLQYSDDDMRQLEKRKIIYVLCRDEREIEKLTGFQSRGMYMLAYDYVTTSYSCHFHELMHLLVNFKLRRLPLYTHPLLQEGLAVACGGRGGIAPQSLVQSGVFLCQTKALSYVDLLAVGSFHSVDPSLTYPVSGLYVRFLIDRLGIGRLLELYRKYSADGEHIQAMVVDTTDLPPKGEWEAFIGKVGSENPIQVSSPTKDETEVLVDSALEIWESGCYYHVRMKTTVALKPEDADPQYESKQFAEMCPGRTYHGERFLFVGDTNEVTIYDLYTNNSIAGYSSGFSPSMDRVQQQGGKLDFWVLKEMFGESVASMQVVRYDE